MHLIPIAGLIVLMTGSAAAAGPWPRGEGKLFVSVGYEGSIDLDRLPFYVLEHAGTLYAEYGIGPRTTLGLDVHGDLENGHTAIGFLRRTLTAPDSRHQFAVSLGAGTRSDGAGEQMLVMAGASWGRGFSSRWGDGWMTADAQVRLWDSGETALKLDTTLGLKPWPDWMVIGQLQVADYPGSETTARLRATAVRRLNDRFSIEMGVVAGVMNDTRAGVTFGLWTEF